MTLDEMWERLVQHQPYANQKGYGEIWANMCAERTQEAAASAYAAAIAAAMASLAVAHASDNERRTIYARRVIQWIKKAEGKNND
jgi:hypothetical protein